MVPGVFKFIINGTSAQNNLFRNQPDETIEAVNKKKNELDQKTLITCPHVSQLHIHSHSMSRSQNVHTPL